MVRGNTRATKACSRDPHYSRSSRMCLRQSPEVTRTEREHRVPRRDDASAVLPIPRSRRDRGWLGRLGREGVDLEGDLSRELTTCRCAARDAVVLGGMATVAECCCAHACPTPPALAAPDQTCDEAGCHVEEAVQNQKGSPHEIPKAQVPQNANTHTRIRHQWPHKPRIENPRAGHESAERFSVDSVLLQSPPPFPDKFWRSARPGEQRWCLGWFGPRPGRTCDAVSDKTCPVRPRHCCFLPSLGRLSLATQLCKLAKFRP